MTVNSSHANISHPKYTVKTFGLLQPYFGCLSCMPVVYANFKGGYQSHSE